MPRANLLLALVIAVALALPAHAYLDPASGSMLLQLVLGGAAGAAVAVKVFWRRITAFFGRGAAEGVDGEPPEPPQR